MNRTRIVFFIVLAVTLVILSTSIMFHIMNVSTINQIFIATSIFSLGVVALDFLGILGGDEDGHTDTGLDLDTAFDTDLDIDADASVDGDMGHVHGDSSDSIEGISRAGHLFDIDDPNVSRSGLTILSLLMCLRLFVYFCLGFGPTGWVALRMGWNPLSSLFIAIPIGIISLLLSQMFFRFQRSNIDSSIKEYELLRQKAVVTIPMTHKTMGKVRIQMGMNVTERYALAANQGAEFHKGDTVQIVQVTDESLYVI